MEKERARENHARIKRVANRPPLTTSVRFLQNSKAPSLEEAPILSKEWFAFRKRKWLGIAATRRIKAQLNAVKDSVRLGEVMAVSIFERCVLTSTCSYMCSCWCLVRPACTSEAMDHDANSAVPSIHALAAARPCANLIHLLPVAKGGGSNEGTQRCPASAARIVEVYGPTL